MLLLRDELLKQSGIANARRITLLSGHMPICLTTIFYKMEKICSRARDVKMNYIDTRFLQTLNIKPVAGRLFSDEYYTEDTTGNRCVIK